MSDEEKTKEVRPFLIITGNGYWGKGMTALEAARHANIGSSWMNATLYQNNCAIDGEINCSGMGGTEWTYETWMSYGSMNKELRNNIRKLIHAAVRVAHGRARIRKGKLIIESEFD